MIVVCAMLKTVDGKGDEVEQEFKKLAAKVLNDPGTIAYEINRALDDANKFPIYEKYDDMDALKLHSSTEHFKEFGRATGAMFSRRPEIGLYNQVS